MNARELNPRAFRRTLTRSVALPLGLTLALAAILLGEVFYLLAQQRWLWQTDRIVEQTYIVERLLVDLETGVRGFVLTGETPFLQPYERASPQVAPALEQLEELVADDPRHVRRVRATRELHERWEQFARELVGQRRAGGDVEALERTARGKQHTDAMREQLEGLLDDARRTRDQRLRASSRFALVVLLSCGGLTVLLGALLGWSTRRSLLRLDATYRASLDTIDRQNEALRQSEHRYRQLIELSPEGMAVLSGGIVRYANPALLAIVGATDPAQVIGRPTREFVHPDYHELVRQRTVALVERGERVPLVEHRLIRLDGSEVWVEATAGPFLYDGQPAAQVLVRDVTARRAAEEGLRRSEAMLAEAQAIAHLGSWQWNVNSGEVSWSDEMYRIFGVEPSQFRPQVDWGVSFVHPEDLPRVRDAMEKARGGLVTGQPFDFRVTRPGGEVRYLSARAQFVEPPAPAGLPPRLVGTVLDVTDRMRAEEQLRQLNETLEQRVRQRTAELDEAVEALRAFSYTVSHGLRAPLRAIQGLAQRLLESPGAGDGGSGGRDEGSAVAEHARRIIASAARLDRMTEEILEYSRLSRQELVPQRISTVLLLHDVIGQLQRDPDRAGMRVGVREPMPWVLAHRATLASVVSNLLANAATFVTPGVTPVIHVWSEMRDGFARIWFEDNGVGIPPEAQERIFHPFERLNDSPESEGTGLGLAIVRRGVERMGGRVGVESEPGRGSRFWIELPADPHSP